MKYRSKTTLKIFFIPGFIDTSNKLLLDGNKVNKVEFNTKTNENRSKPKQILTLLFLANKPIIFLTVF